MACPELPAALSYAVCNAYHTVFRVFAPYWQMAEHRLLWEADTGHEGYSADLP